MNCKEIISEITEVPYKICLYDTNYYKTKRIQYAWIVHLGNNIYEFISTQDAPYNKKEIKYILNKLFNRNKEEYKYYWHKLDVIPPRWILIKEISEYEYRNNKY